MRTTHEIVVGDARSMADVADASVELVVTSPPYPMIEMWDATFEALDPDVGAALRAGDGGAAFDRMHAVLGDVWDGIDRVLAPGGIACVNVGDATRSIDGAFRRYPNHAAITRAFRDRGFRALPSVLWRKPTNSTTKFMGSGTLPPNAYVTLEHEHVLVFRKGGPRRFDAGDGRRYESAFFWEERNAWFSDVWSVTGEPQGLDGPVRDRSGAFPLEIPARLIAMFSVHGDTVLDPFWGTGTTSLAAMAAARNSIGYEIDGSLVSGFDDRVGDLPRLSRDRVEERLAAHRSFVAERREAGEGVDHEATHYDFPVVSAQETEIKLYAVDSIEETDAGYAAEHVPVVEGIDSPRPDAS